MKKIYIFLISLIFLIVSGCGSGEYKYLPEKLELGSSMEGFVGNSSVNGNEVIVNFKNIDRTSSLVFVLEKSKIETEDGDCQLATVYNYDSRSSEFEYNHRGDLKFRCEDSAIYEKKQLIGEIILTYEVNGFEYNTKGDLILTIM